MLTAIIKSSEMRCFVHKSEMCRFILEQNGETFFSIAVAADVFNTNSVVQACYCRHDAIQTVKTDKVSGDGRAKGA